VANALTAFSINFEEKFMGLKILLLADFLALKNKYTKLTIGSSNSSF